MDMMKITNYTRLPNLVMLLLGLLQPMETIALPVLEGKCDLEDLLPYLKQGGIQIQWYHEEKLTKSPQDSSLAEALLLPIQWAAYFPALCEYQQKKHPLILLKWSNLSQVVIPEAIGIMQIEMYNESLKNSDYFFVSCCKNLLLRFRRLSCYDMVEIPSFPRNDR